ncbi:hypothetical protein D3C76_1345320 [compost metagenome]
MLEVQAHAALEQEARHVIGMQTLLSADDRRIWRSAPAAQRVGDYALGLGTHGRRERAVGLLRVVQVDKPGEVLGYVAATTAGDLAAG